MKKSNSVHPSVKIDNALLKGDRRSAGFTQASFAAACDSVSIATIRRAEQGYRVIEISLRRMADVLEQPYERYISPQSLDEAADYVTWIEGEWKGLFVEADRGLLPHIVSQDLAIRQGAARVEGGILATTPNGARMERFIESKILNNVFTGFILMEDRNPPIGLYAFNMVVSRNNDWLEGFFTWFDPDTERTEVSRAIAVRKSSPDYLRYFGEAQITIERELSVYRLRKLTESGYPLSDAATMLGSLENQSEAILADDPL